MEENAIITDEDASSSQSNKVIKDITSKVYKSTSNFYPFYKYYMENINLTYIPKKEKDTKISSILNGKYTDYIYEDDECFIISDNISKNIPHLIIIKDSDKDNKYRFFIGFRIKNEYPQYNIIGMIVDISRKSLYDNTYSPINRDIINSIIFNYDERDYFNMCGYNNAKNIFLYNNILFTYIKYRDHYNIVSLGLAFIDKIIYEDSKIYTIENIQFSSPKNENINVQLSTNKVYINPNNIYIDLDSVHIKNENNNINLCYKIYNS